MTNYVTGDTIRYLRERRHLTQRELAERLNVSDKTISKWETSRGLPDITLLEPLASTLSVSVAELLSGEHIENGNRAANLQKSHFYVCPCLRQCHLGGRRRRVLLLWCDTAAARSRGGG